MSCLIHLQLKRTPEIELMLFADYTGDSSGA